MVNAVIVLMSRLLVLRVPSRVSVVPEVNAVPIVIVSVPLNSGRPSGFQLLAVPQLAFAPPPSQVVPALADAIVKTKHASAKAQKI